MSARKHFIIWGSAGHATVLADIIAQNGDVVVALFDNNPAAQSVLSDVPLYIGESAFMDWLKTANLDYSTLYGAIAIGGQHGFERQRIQKLLQHNQIVFPALIHSNATVSPTAQILAGTQVLAQAVVAAHSQIGESCIINHHANVDHECILGNGVHLAPAATLCGCVELGEHVMIGAAAVVLPRIRIGAGSIVGAGAVVTKDIPAGVVVTGSPARIISHV